MADEETKGAPPSSEAGGAPVPAESAPAAPAENETNAESAPAAHEANEANAESAPAAPAASALGAPDAASPPVELSAPAHGLEGAREAEIPAIKPKAHIAAFHWIRDYFLGEDPQYIAALVPFCFLSMVLFTRHPLRTNFIFDEQEALLANPYVRSVMDKHPKFHWLDAFKRDFWGLGPERSIGSYRPIPNLVWRFLWMCGAREHNPFLHHWVNVLVHGANGALLTMILWKVTKRKGLSWLAGMFLVASAVLTEAVSGVVGISDVFGTLGCLIALYGLTFRAPIMAVLVVLGSLIGLYSKESAMIVVPMVPLFALATASALFPKAPRRVLRTVVALVAAGAAFVFYVESRRRLFPTTLPAELTNTVGKPLGKRLFAAGMRWYAQPVLPKDPLNNPLAEADSAHRIAGALRVYFRGLAQVVFPKTLSGDYSAPQEPIPPSLFSLEIVLGFLCLVLPTPIAGWLGVRAFLDGRKRAREAAAASPPEDALAFLRDPAVAASAEAEPAKSSAAPVSAADVASSAAPVPAADGASGAGVVSAAPAAEATGPAPLVPAGEPPSPAPPFDARPLVAASLVWVLACYFPVSNIPILLPTVRAERFWYFPVVGSSILLAVLFSWLADRGAAKDAAATRGSSSAEGGLAAGVPLKGAGLVMMGASVALVLFMHFSTDSYVGANFAIPVVLGVYGLVTLVRGARTPQVRVAYRSLAVTACVFFTLFQCVAARLHANDYTTDIDFWDATRKAVPRSAKAHLNYSVMKGARGDLEARRVSNLRALELAPEWPMASIYLGDTLCRMHRAEEAWPHYKKGFALAHNDVNLLALGIQCLWDEKAVTPPPKAPEGEPTPADSPRRAELRALAAQHPGSWLEWLTNDIVANGESHNGVDPKYRPRGYNEGPKE